MGLESVPNSLSRFLPEVDLSNRPHREAFMRKMAMFANFHGGITEEALLRLYEVGGSLSGATGVCREPARRSLSITTLMCDPPPNHTHQAQTLWDEYMAESASKVLEGGSNKRLVVMAGNGHIENRWGIPDRIAR
jgi:hypothetical protein